MNTSMQWPVSGRGQGTPAPAACPLTLPFVTDTNNGRAFWHVSPSGDYVTDFESGRRYAATFNQALRQQAITPLFLANIVSAFPSPLTAMEHGFLSQVSVGVMS